jgi:hypothetical protein
MAELIVRDEEYTALAGLYNAFFEKLEGGITAYCNTLDSVAANGIKAGEAHDKLVLLKDSAAALKGTVEPLVSAAADKYFSYCDRIDEIDKYVY